jgi:hypothetical protein
MLGLALTGAGLYARSLPAPFLPDDERSITENRQIRTLSPLSVPLSPPRDTPVAGRPLVNLTFAANYAVGGLDPRGYRAVNIALHIGAAMLLFGLVRRSVLLRPGIDAHQPHAAGLAGICALIWLVHPLQTEAVIYLSQRSELMMGTAYLATLYCAARGWRRTAVATCALGMLCKESMVTAPVMVVLYERMFRFASFKDAFRQHGRFYTGLALTWLVLAAILAGRPRSAVGITETVTPLSYLWNQCVVLIHYLQQAIWPTSLVWDYGLPRSLTIADVWPQAVVLTTLFMTAVVMLMRSSIVGFLMMWVFLTLAPTSSLVPITTEVGAERRMYLPLAGLVVLGVLAGQLAFAKLSARVRYAAAIAVCVMLCWAAYVRSLDYLSFQRLAQTTVDRWPSGRGHYQLAMALYDSGQIDAAVRELGIAAADFPGAHLALGTHYLARQQLDTASAELEAFIQAMPSHPNATLARDFLGRIHLSQGRVAEALRLFQLVLQVPDYPQRAEVLQLQQQAESLRRRQ